MVIDPFSWHFWVVFMIGIAAAVLFKFIFDLINNLKTVHHKYDYRFKDVDYNFSFHMDFLDKFVVELDKEVDFKTFYKEVMIASSNKRDYGKKFGGKSPDEIMELGRYKFSFKMDVVCHKLSK